MRRRAPIIACTPVPLNWNNPMQMPDFTVFPVKSGIFCSLQRVKKVCAIPRERMSPVRQSAPQNLPKRHAATVFRLRIEKNCHCEGACARGNPHPKMLRFSGYFRQIGLHQGERIATPVCALVRNDRFRAVYLIYQQSFAPAGMASSTMSRFSFSSPFTLWTAEISIPQDSRPIIFRGGRFVMATRVLPISSSGL